MSPLGFQCERYASHDQRHTLAECRQCAVECTDFVAEKAAGPVLWDHAHSYFGADQNEVVTNREVVNCRNEALNLRGDGAAWGVPRLGVVKRVGEPCSQIIHKDGAAGWVGKDRCGIDLVLRCPVRGTAFHMLSDAVGKIRVARPGARSGDVADILICAEFFSKH